jgi:hypothetical protein
MCFPVQVLICKAGFAVKLRGNTVISPVAYRPRIRILGKQCVYTQTVLENFWQHVE